MKVCIVMHPISNIGGIVNHTEQLIAGLKDLGHEVNFMIPDTNQRYARWDEDKIQRLHDENPHYWEWGEGTGLLMNQNAGWCVRPYIERKTFRTDENLRDMKDFLNSHDIVIWTIPVVTKKKSTRGSMRWTELYKLDESTKQIMIFHDGNFERSYPWVNHLKEHVDGIACVHMAAYNGAANIDIPRALILNPQNMDNVHKDTPYNERKPGFLSVQTFKAWKRVEDLVRAIPHMSPETVKMVGGGGLEYGYMTSPNKTKPNYFSNEKDNPGLAPEDYTDPALFENGRWDELQENGKRIFEVAEKHGMEWLGYINEHERDQRLRKVRTLIDPSWSLRYASIGDHFNRVVVDAMKQGAIPIARNMGISDNEEGVSVIFKPGRNYIMIPYNATPKEFAEIVEYANNMPSEEAEEIIQRNFEEVLPYFERKKVAQDYIDLAFGRDCGYFGKLETGVLSDKVRDNSEYMMNTHFNAPDENGNHPDPKMAEEYYAQKEKEDEPVQRKVREPKPEEPQFKDYQDMGDL